MRVLFGVRRPTDIQEKDKVASKGASEELLQKKKKIRGKGLKSEKLTQVQCGGPAIAQRKIRGGVWKKRQKDRTRKNLNQRLFLGESPRGKGLKETEVREVETVQKPLSRKGICFVSQQTKLAQKGWRFGEDIGGPARKGEKAPLSGNEKGLVSVQKETQPSNKSDGHDNDE